MSRFRMYPTSEQETVLLGHCAHARFVWNLACEQQAWFRPGRGNPPGYAEQNRQLTAARREFGWLAAGSVTVRQKAGLNRAILASGGGMLATRVEQKAPGRVEKIPAAYTSQRCSRCGHVAAESRESQAVYRCVACRMELHADVNAARNIAAGRAVTAHGDLQGLPGSGKCEPLSDAARAASERNPRPSERGGRQERLSVLLLSRGWPLPAA